MTSKLSHKNFTKSKFITNGGLETHLLVDVVCHIPYHDGYAVTMIRQHAIGLVAERHNSGGLQAKHLYHTRFVDRSVIDLLEDWDIHMIGKDILKVLVGRVLAMAGAFLLGVAAMDQGVWLVEQK